MKQSEMDEFKEVYKHLEGSEARLEALHTFVFKDRALKVVTILEHETTGELHCLYGDVRDVDKQGFLPPVRRTVTQEKLKEIQETAQENVQSILRGLIS